MYTVKLIALLLLPLLGRASGGAFGSLSGLYAALIGVAFGVISGFTGWELLLFAVAGRASEAIDPASDALGNITDGHGSRQDWVDLTMRGVIGALPYLFLIWIFPAYLMLIFIPAWPLAVWVGTKLPKYSAWEWSEILRYTFVGGFLWLVL